MRLSALEGRNFHDSSMDYFCYHTSPLPPHMREKSVPRGFISRVLRGPAEVSATISLCGWVEHLIFLDNFSEQQPLWRFVVL
ncbi:hypothetical protein KIN20_010735 [Parelaphostrongylus tenuis]|uniref:Uncharacterized protein n=1 Tax=Parelaphostrongylus tenuis TaxID=148309 RepID=A0AAD5M8B9_PARTN|nr:hypothetical protein KIN20_010735 [Parelaphostrongylus tenuis]